MCIRELHLELVKVTESYRQSYTYNVTERSFRAHWIPQCGPGNKAADGALHASHTPCPSRLQHPWSSHPTMTKSGENPPLRNLYCSPVIHVPPPPSVLVLPFLPCKSFCESIDSVYLDVDHFSVETTSHVVWR